MKNSLDLIALTRDERTDLLPESGARDKFKVIVGGVAVNQELAKAIDADHYGSYASRAVGLIKKLLA
ncbi:MAG: hypothetical protein JRJ59_02580 [Deltaproteobacteria bacterium]|nr:hypothetical protein [Deltaproteobacteria bacterium]